MSEEKVEAVETETVEKAETIAGGAADKVAEIPANEKTSEAAPEKEAAAEKGIAGGKTDEPAEPDANPFWHEEWRAKMAEHVAAGDKKAFDREMKRLERLSDPAAVYGMYRELEAKFSTGGLTKIPGKDATEEELKAFHKALGVPEDPKEYVENLKLPDGVTLGERDKPLAQDFASAMHNAGLTQTQMDQAYSWYMKTEEARAATIDEQDEQNRTEAMRELKEEYGPAFKRNVNAISSLFAYAPGGADAENENSLFNRLLAGRTADGRIVGDDPQMVRFLISLAKEVNPVATVVETADGTGKGIDDEIKEIESVMKTDRRRYDKDKTMQARYLELLGAREKNRARNAA